MNNAEFKNEELVKKVWIKPELQVLDIAKDTLYWSFEFDPNTGFFKNKWNLDS